jgi:hypothetical protein
MYYKSTHWIYVLIINISLFSVGTAFGRQTSWEIFVAKPEIATQAKLEKLIAKCKKIKCEVPSDNVTNKFVSLIESKNPLALEVAFKSLNLFDGGNLEDIIRALGTNIEMNPEQFLILQKKHIVSIKLKRKLLTMLPLNLVDNSPIKINALKNRIGAISSVTNPALKKEIDLSQEILNHAYQELNSITAK